VGRDDYARAIVETIRQPLIVLDRQQRVVSANPAFHRQFETTAHESEGETLWAIGRHEWDVPALRQLVGELLEGGEPIEGFEVHHELEKHGPRILLVNARRVTPRVGQPPLIVVAFEDVTVQRVAERSAAAPARRLERSNRDLEEFAHAASHDLQEPLRKVRAFTAQLIASLDPEELDERQSLYAQRITAAAERMQLRIDDLLELARVSRVEPRRRPVDLARTMERVLGDLAARIEETGASIEVDPLPTIDADESLIELLFQNLLSNAIKYRKAGEAPTVRVMVARTDAQGDEEGWLELTIEDEGIGFDPAYAEQIFRPFERLHGRAEYEGSGVGLSVCRRVAEHHGGTMVADATPQEGARFTVRLPATQSTGADPA
jgi:PAS domain S-box-containing protein